MIKTYIGRNIVMSKKLNLLFVVLGILFVVAACQSNKDKEVTTDKEKPAKVDEALVAAKVQFELLGDVPIPEDNPMTDEKIELGKQLFFDPRLSGDDSLSCMSCHLPNEGFGDGLATFIGFEDFEGARNSQTIINSAFYKELFWDGRAASLEEQALGPIQDPGEMNLSLDELVKKLNEVPEYVEAFQDVFESDITPDTVAKALAAFQRTIVITDTAFDRYLQGDDDAINAEAKEGMKLFVDKSGCISCHNGPLLSNNDYHNTGLSGDDGRYAVTDDEADKGKFRTPGLRGASHTAPFMHDGSLATLEDVVNYYNAGGGGDANKDPLKKPLGLTPEEVKQLVAFLESMSGEVPEVSIPSLP